jgi:hypothetical protein
MNKETVREKLLTLFGPVHVEGWLSHFPDNHDFAPTFAHDFVDYLNSLPPINPYPDEA